jgi:hypothetical protein
MHACVTREQSSEVAMRRFVLALALATGAACTGRDPARDTADAAGGPVVATQAFGRLGVPVGWARPFPRDTVLTRWCADFEEYELAVGDTVTLVWPDSGSGPASVATTRVDKAMPAGCDQVLNPTGDAIVVDATSYELFLTNPTDSAAVADLARSPAIAVRGGAPWTRGPDHFMRADLDGDENPEQARLCTSNEGVHLTLWTLVDSAAAGTPRAHRRWHAYQPLGYDVEPSCTARETDDPPGPPGEGR